MREPPERIESIADLDAIESRMMTTGRDYRRCSAACGGLREIVVTVGADAAQSDEYRTRRNRAGIDADAASAASDARRSGRANESAAGGLDHFCDRELALIERNRRGHRDTLCRIMRGAHTIGFLT